MRDLAVLVLHLLATVARLAGPGGVRSVVAESVLVKQQFLILNRSRKTVAQSPSRRSRCRRPVYARHAPGPADSLRDRRQAVNAVAPSARADTAEVSPAFLVQGADEARPQGNQPGSYCRGRRHEQRNPIWGCPRIAQQIILAFGIPINKDVVRRILATRYQPTPDSAGPSWLTVLGHAKDSLWSLDLFRCESAILHTHWVLGDGPMYEADRGLRRAPRRRR